VSNREHHLLNGVLHLLDVSVTSSPPQTRQTS
jgi:hypothetical protein